MYKKDALMHSGYSKTEANTMSMETAIKRKKIDTDVDRVLKKSRGVFHGIEGDVVDMRASVERAEIEYLPGQMGIAWVKGMTEVEVTFLEDLVAGERAALGFPDGSSWMGSVLENVSVNKHETAIVEKGHERCDRIVKSIDPPSAGWVVRMEKALENIKLGGCPRKDRLRLVSNVLYMMYVMCMLTEEERHRAIVTMQFASMLTREMMTPANSYGGRKRTFDDSDEDAEVVDDPSVAPVNKTPQEHSPGQRGFGWVKGLTVKELMYLEDLAAGENTSQGDKEGGSWLENLVKREKEINRDVDKVVNGHDRSETLVDYIDPPSAGWVMRMEEVLKRIKLEGITGKHRLRVLSNVLYVMYMTCMLTKDSSHTTTVTMFWAGMLVDELTPPVSKQDERRTNGVNELSVLLL